MNRKYDLFWTVLTTVGNGSLTDLDAQVSYAKSWYMGAVRGCAVGCGVGQVGDASGSGDNKPTLGDISALIDYLFITGPGLGLKDCFYLAD